MINIWDVIADFIQKFAELGAGFQSIGSSYEPEIPEELKENI